MITANEARIVYEENIEKEIARNIEERQREIEYRAYQKAMREEEQVFMADIAKHFLPPIGEAIAERAANGYRKIEIITYISGYGNNYVDDARHIDARDVGNFWSKNREKYKYYHCVGSNLKDSRSYITRLIAEYFQTIGYKIHTSDVAYCWQSTDYSAYQTITIEW